MQAVEPENGEVEVDNPNEVELGLNWLEYRISSGGQQLADGVYRQEFKVPALGKNKVMLPLSVDTRNAFKVMQTYLEEPTAYGGERRCSRGRPSIIHGIPPRT